MTLLELRDTIAGIQLSLGEDAKLRDMFLQRLDAWATDSTTIARLVDDLNRLLGNVWFSTAAAHERIVSALDAFATNVRQIGGMTMNERLFVFGLLEIWDRSSDSAKSAIRVKLEAA